MFLFVITTSSQSPQPQIEVSFPINPIPFTSGDKSQIAYEIHLTNFGRVDLSLSALEINNENGAIIGNLREPELSSVLKKIGRNDDSLPKSLLESGRRIVVFVWLKVAQNRPVPKSLRHKLIFESNKNDGSQNEFVLDGVALELNKTRVAVIGSPLRGRNWVVANGASNFSNHRQTIITLDGKPQISQRFAIDFAKLGNNGILTKGNSKINEDYFGYGEEVFAVGNAKVVSVQGDIPENIPLGKPVVPITYKSITGNYIILDIGNGFYAFYGHLQPQSIKVKVGEKVKKGQAIAAIGNSGNSDLPHLHFHVSNKNSALASEGMPFLFNEFYEFGFVDSPDELADGKGWNPSNKQDPVLIKNQHPQNNSVISLN